MFEINDVPRQNETWDWYYLTINLFQLRSSSVKSKQFFDQIYGKVNPFYVSGSSVPPKNVRKPEVF